MSFEGLKERHAAAWGAAPFERVAETAAEVHDDLVASLAPKPGERWLDIATGTGAVATRAARAGAEVVGVDIAPALIMTARQLAAAEGLNVHFEVGDAERLGYGDASFDVVASAQGTMFAPDHQAVARELIRLCRRDGRLGLTCWRPGGAIETFFSLLAEFQPPPPPGAGNPLDWGRAEHVRELLGEAFELELLKRSSPQTGRSGEEVWQLFSTSFGPLKTLADALDRDQHAQLHRAFVEYYEGYRTADGIAAPREYLLIGGASDRVSLGLPTLCSSGAQPMVVRLLLPSRRVHLVTSVTRTSVARPGGQTAVRRRRRASITERDSRLAGTDGATRPAGRASHVSRAVTAEPCRGSSAGLSGQKRVTAPHQSASTGQGGLVPLEYS